MLGLMAKDFFTQSPVLLFPIAALIVFTVAFTALTIRTLRQDKSELDEIARAPLADDMPKVEN